MNLCHKLPSCLVFPSSDLHDWGHMLDSKDLCRNVSHSRSLFGRCHGARYHLHRSYRCSWSTVLSIKRRSSLSDKKTKAWSERYNVFATVLGIDVILSHCGINSNINILWKWSMNKFMQACTIINFFHQLDYTLLSFVTKALQNYRHRPWLISLRSCHTLHLHL